MNLRHCLDVVVLLLAYSLSFICRGCLLVRQSFFHNEPKNFIDLRGGVFGCRGFHSSFRATQGGLSLNMGNSLRSFNILFSSFFFFLPLQNKSSKLMSSLQMFQLQ